MNYKSEITNIQILGREYHINCPESEKHALAQAAELVEEKMSVIRMHGKTSGMERIAVMAALNLADELLRAKQEPVSEVHPEELVALQEEMQRLTMQVTQALEQVRGKRIELDPLRKSG